MVEGTTPTEESEPLVARFRPNTIGQVFGAMVAVGGGSFIISFFSVFGYVILVDPPDGAPLPLPITLAGIGSWVCVTVGSWGYVVWAGWKLRSHQRNPGQRTGSEVVGHSDDRELYQQRQRRLLSAIGLGLFALLTPVAMVAGSPGR